MHCVIAVAGNGEELWVYGHYVNEIDASNFAEKMQARYPEIEYVVAELLDPGQAGRRSDGYFSRSNEAGHQGNEHRAMGFNRRKLEDQRRQAAEKEAASRRATDPQVLEGRGRPNRRLERATGQQSGDTPYAAASVSNPESAAAGASVLKSGIVNGMPYTLYSDGSIEAQLPEGTLRFGSITELRNHIEQSA